MKFSIHFALKLLLVGALLDPALAHFNAAQSAYNLGRFDEALEGYTKSYELKHLPALLFNIAQCHRQLSHFERAAFFYRRYLALSPRAPKNASLVESLIAEMDEKAAAEQRRLDEEAAAAAAQRKRVEE